MKKLTKLKKIIQNKKKKQEKRGVFGESKKNLIKQYPETAITPHIYSAIENKRDGSHF